MGLSVTASPSVLPGGTTVAGDFQVNGRMGLGMAPSVGARLAMTNPVNTDIPLYVLGAPAQAVNLIHLEKTAGVPVAAVHNTGGVGLGNGVGIGGTVWSGTGAPAAGLGADGDIYNRIDGAALTTIYQRRAGAWVGIV